MDAYALAERTYAQAQGIADRHGLADPLLHYNRGLNALRQGEPDRARAQFRAAAALEPQAESLLGRRIAAEFAALDGGPDAMPRLAALAEAQRIDDPSGAAITRLRLSSLALAAGRTQDALTHADAAIALVGGSGFQRERRDGLRARVEALRAGGRLDAALAALEQLHREEREAVRMQNLDALAGLQARLEDGRSAEELQRLRETQRIDALQARHAQTLRTAGAIGLLLLVALASAFALYQRRISRRLRRLSTIDSLTGLLNRRAATAAMETFPPPAAIARRHVAFLVDIDHFKRSNDRHGHGVGDAILVEIARRFQQVCRPGDLVARWGGEEFLIVARALDAESAAAIAERLRREIAGDARWRWARRPSR
ncbi:GGDEF domain-containing protein [Luteimonas deserti]|uniref:diguanylate cyclase n=1 Tax=Luteimonas deserti TaxID=2752306 RepID=A0A7Z0QTU6_9GAMM|nr:GGDEF domain-containing protein [Luteimonas deserti]NYZ63348.1 GGDEF domain-containing protein [Luteimonas deserti]